MMILCTLQFFSSESSPELEENTQDFGNSVNTTEDEMNTPPMEVMPVKPKVSPFLLNSQPELAGDKVISDQDLFVTNPDGSPASNQQVIIVR